MRSDLLLQQAKEHGRRRQAENAKQQVDVHDARQHSDLEQKPNVHENSKYVCEEHSHIICQ